MSEARSAEHRPPIVVALDPSSFGRAALEAAAEIAALTGAELHGIFVEDIDLVRLAQLRIAVELGYPSALRRALDPEAVERSMRTLGRRLASELADVAGRARVRSAFHVTRGTVLTELLKAAEGAGLVVVGRSGGRITRLRVGSIARRMALTAPQSVWVQHEPCVGRPVMIVARDDHSSEAAAEAAARLRRSARDGVAVAVAGVDEAPARRLEHRAVQLVQQRGLTAVSSCRLPSEPAALVGAVRRLRPGVLIVSAHDPTLPTLLEETGCTILVVR